MTVADRGEPRVGHRAELERKLIHLGTVILPVAWGLNWLTTAQVRGILLALALIAVTVEAGRRMLPPVHAWFLAWFGPMLRTHERTTLTGATWGALTMLAMVWIAPTRSAQVAMWAVIVGDGLASVIGTAWRQKRRSAHGGKTLIGSLVVLIATAIGAWWLGGAAWPTATLVGAITALAERPTRPLDDNIRVPMAAGLAAWAMGVG